MNILTASTPAAMGGAPACASATANQIRYVKAELAERGTYMIAVGHHVAGPFSATRFRAAASALVQRHAALRSRFKLQDGQVTVQLAPNPSLECHIMQLTDQSLSAFRAWALPRVRHRVDPMKPGSLIRFLAADYGHSWRFTIAGHHAITDGLSRGVMNRDLLKLYVGEDLAPASSYYDYGVAGPAPADALAESATRAAALPKPLRIVPDAITDQHHAETGQFLSHDMGPIQKQLNRTAKSIGTTKFGLLAAIYALGLRGVMGDDRVSSFFQSAGRQSLNAPASVVGSFSNTLPLDLTVDLDQPFASFAQGLKNQTQDVIALENTPLLDHVLAQGQAPTVALNLFPREAPIRAGNLQIGAREFLDRQTEFDLNLMWAEDKEGLKARAFYNGARLSEDRITLFLDMQHRLLTAALDQPEAPCAKIIQTARQGREAASPITSPDPAPTGRLHSAFFAQAAKTPAAPAIIQTDNQISYATLATRALDIARGLQAAGVKDTDRVAIFAQRTPEMVAAMLGVSAYGCAFALIDCTYPTARITRMLDTINTPFVIEAGATLPPEIAQGMTQITPQDGTAFTPVEGDTRAEACVLFTSGTTGAPKMISHPDRAILRFLHWQTNSLDLNTPIVTTMMAGLGHDPTMRDAFLPFLTGGSIALPSATQMGEPCTLRRLIRDAGCNVLRLSVTTGRLLATGMPPDERFANLKAIFWGGERLPSATVATWRTLAPNTRQFNVFGTTETPQCFLIHEVTQAADTGDLPLGHPLPHTGARIVDRDGAPVALGEVGELVADLSDTIGGSHHPHPHLRDTEPKSHYTGDLAFQMPDGGVRYIGRRDTQIKVNGFRVELGEIEATTETLPGVTRATALWADNRIQLFVLSDPAKVSDRSLRLGLTQQLPSYMLPQHITVLDRFPTTPNGKVDPAALLALALQPQHQPTAEDTRPLIEAEEVLAQIFARITKCDRVQPHHALADLGADSLATIEVRLALEQRGMTLPDGWAVMPLSDLATHLPVATHHGGPAPSHPRVDMFVLLRCIAILSIVAFHSGFQLVGGASIMLFVLAGYSFAQMQLPGVLRDDHAGRVWALLSRLLIPLVPISLLYLAFNIYTGAVTHPSSLAFYRNLVDLGSTLWTGQMTEVRGLEWLWFLHAYLQVFLLFGLILSVPAVRQALSAHLWRGVFVAFALSEVVSIAGLMVVAQITGDPATAALLLFRSPTTLIPFIALGGLVATARGQTQTAISFAMVALHAAVTLWAFPTHDEPWWVLALILCARIPAVSLTRPLAVAVVQIAAASLMIYLTHSLVLDSIKWVMGPTALVRGVSIFAQVVVGVGVAMALRPMMRQLYQDGGGGGGSRDPVPLRA